MLWFIGLGPRPTFERWAYWEKFDFWAVWADVVMIGTTGLIIWFPNLFCSSLPGAVLNIAKVIHSTQALLATGFLFAVHFFNAHLRAEKFPAEMSVLTGLVGEEEMQKNVRNTCAAWKKRVGLTNAAAHPVPARLGCDMAGRIFVCRWTGIAGRMVVAGMAE